MPLESQTYPTYHGLLPATSRCVITRLSQSGDKSIKTSEGILLIKDEQFSFLSGSLANKVLRYFIRRQGVDFSELLWDA